ncbi:MAG TPA: hypothetical protein VEC36_09255 [Patescibacteria group bacterium]|nr:hypothetical protein [Patescibacteria group bacterium]
MNANPFTNQRFPATQSNSFFGGIFGELLLSNGSTSFVLKTQYSNFTTASVAIIESSKLPDEKTMSIRHSIHFSSSFFNVELIGFQRIIDQFGFGLGIGAGFPIKSDMDTRFTLISPQEAHFERDPNADSKGIPYSDDNRTIFVDNEDVANRQLFVKLGVRYGFQFDRISISPSLFYNLALNNATRQESFTMNVLQLEVDMGFGV